MKIKYATIIFCSAALSAQIFSVPREVRAEAFISEIPEEPKIEPVWVKKKFPGTPGLWIEGFKSRVPVNRGIGPIPETPSQFEQWEIAYYLAPPQVPHQIAPGKRIPRDLVLNHISRADPSLAYSATATNSTSDPGEIWLTTDVPITPFGDATISSEFFVELIDANNDGLAFLNVDGRLPLQQGWVASADHQILPGTTIDLGLDDISEPGVYTFHSDPIQVAGHDTEGLISLILSNVLSAGDTINISGRFTIDDGVIPSVDIPPTPDPSNFCKGRWGVINSPPALIGNDESIQSCTTLNVLDGGSIGDNFDVGDSIGGSIDAEVNIMGGTVGKRFDVYNSVANISGGTIGDGTPFSFENILAAYGGSEVNITGGLVQANVTANEGSVVNISGGTVLSFSGTGGEINFSGGSTTSTSSIRGSELNVSGGTIQSLLAGPESVVDFSGGETISFVIAEDNSVINVTGGELNAGPTNDGVVAQPGSMVNLFGTQFLLDGAPIDGLALDNSVTIHDRDVTLSGVFADGTSFDWPLCAAARCGAFYEPGSTLTVTLVSPADCNGDGIVDIQDANCTSAEGLADFLSGNDFPLGDLDGDHQVAFSDFLTLSENFGGHGEYTDGDFNKSGTIDFADFLVLANNFGASSSVSTVPEPTGSLVLVPAIAACIIARRRLSRFWEKPKGDRKQTGGLGLGYRRGEEGERELALARHWQ